MASFKEFSEQFLGIIRNLTLVQRVVGIVAIAVVFGGLLALSLMGTVADKGVLFSGLAPEDAGRIVEKLQKDRVEYQLAEGGTAVLVPQAHVYELRLNFAAEGIPRGGGVGFEIFDKTSLGTTDFVQRLNYQRALQGEMARTIMQFSAVKGARVHIATPRESIFVEDSQPPSASVSLGMAGEKKLSSREIEAVVNLVASAVPGLLKEKVTVVDTAGNLLHPREKEEDRSLLRITRLQYQKKVEQELRYKVESMFAKVLGEGRAVARVTVDLDFDQVDSTEEVFDPEGQVVRSEQLVREHGVDGSPTQGVPGVKGQLATFTETGGDESGGQVFRRNNSVKNFEITRKTKREQKAVGEVERVTVAVMIDGIYDEVVEGDKTVRKYRSRTSEEISRLTTMTMNAIGFDRDRGDRVEVVSMPFHISARQVVAPDSMDKWRGLIEKIALPLIILIVVMAVIFFVLRPFLSLLAEQSRLRAREKAETSDSEQDGEKVVEEDLSLKPLGLSDKERIYRLAQSDPDRAADLVRRWLREEM